MQLEKHTAHKHGSQKDGAHKHGQKTGRSANLPSKTASEIPDKLYFRIGEVARLCAVQTYVLRFWESEFPQLKPGKSGTGQRLYRRRDVEMALKIRHLLYEEGFTIPGARQAFQLEARSGAAKTRQPELPLDVQSSGATSPVKVQRLKSELREILGMLSRPAGKPRLVDRVRKPEASAPALFTD